MLYQEKPRQPHFGADPIVSSNHNFRHDMDIIPPQLNSRPQNNFYGINTNPTLGNSGNRNLNVGNSGNRFQGNGNMGNLGMTGVSPTPFQPRMNVVTQPRYYDLTPPPMQNLNERVYNSGNRNQSQSYIFGVEAGEVTRPLEERRDTRSNLFGFDETSNRNHFNDDGPPVEGLSADPFPIFNDVTTPESTNEMRGNLSTWVTVFGIPSGNHDWVIDEFRNYGQIVDIERPSGKDWIHLQYKSEVEVFKALTKNGTVFRNFMIGVIPRQDIGAKPSRSPTYEIPEENTYEYQPQNPELAAESTSITGPKPTKSLVSKFLEYVVGY